MWTSTKQMAIQLYGTTRVRFTETRTTLVVEATTDHGTALAHCQLYDALLDLPRGSCTRRFLYGETCIFLFAATSVAMTELVRRYTDLAKALPNHLSRGSYRRAA